jgi:hypothetical protein
MAKMLKMIAAATITIAVPASAGEVTGNGDPTPVANHRASSICSFSGLEDDPVAPGSVQSYGQIVRSLGGGPLPFGPRYSCRGN